MTVRMSDDRVVFLVEHLPRIGATSVSFESFQGPIKVLCEGQELEVKSETGKTISITLPNKVTTDEPLKLTATGQNCYSLRLKSRSQDLAAYKMANQAQNIVMSLPEGKWSKRELVKCEQFVIKCLNCQLPIIDRENCHKLNELPSEFWMELMDYWHCHKPHQPSQEIWYSRNYNSLQPDDGEVVIGGSFFLAQPGTFAGRVKNDNGIVECANCCAALGDETKDHLYKVRKWQLSLSTVARAEDLFPPQQDVVFTLLNLLKGYSTRYVLLASENFQLVVWIFSIGLDVTLPNNTILRNCFKILFRREMPEEEMKKQNIERIEVENLPMQCFVESLESINAMLPSNSKTIDAWRVGYATFTD